MTIKPIAAGVAALALFAGACGGDDDPGASNTNGETTAPTGANTPMETDGRTAAPDTPEGLAAGAGIELPGDFVLADGELVAGETRLRGTYSGDPHGPVTTMQAAGWEHVGTRDGSFIHDFYREGVCTIIYVLENLNFGILASDRLTERASDVGTAEDCATFSEANAREAGFYADL